MLFTSNRKLSHSSWYKDIPADVGKFWVGCTLQGLQLDSPDIPQAFCPAPGQCCCQCGPAALFPVSVYFKQKAFPQQLVQRCTCRGGKFLCEVACTLQGLQLDSSYTPQGFCPAPRQWCCQCGPAALLPSVYFKQEAFPQQLVQRCTCGCGISV